MMESIEKLREYGHDCCARVDDAIHDYCDEIEREIAEHYMELPVDADGESIHVGDALESDEYGGKRFPCRGLSVEVSDRGLRWTVCMSYESYSGTSEYTSASRCRHVKPRTIEDVLSEFRFDANLVYGDPNIGGEDRADELSALDAKYADELRKMIGGDAE